MLVTKIVAGTVGKPGLYSVNFDPTTDPTNSTLLKVEIGTILIQYGVLDEECVGTCAVAIWQKTCESDCETSTWAVVGSGIEVGDFFPHVQIQCTSKVGLKVTLVAEANPIYAPNAPLAYLWSGAGLTFGTATASTTTVTAAAPGDYVATVLVTDADGQTFTSLHVLKLNRVIEIGGADRGISNYFANLTAAIAWRAANDAAQTYKFIIVADTAEPAMIANLDRAHVVWLNGTTTTFATDARGFSWTSVTPVDVSFSAESNRPWHDPNIVVTGREAISFNSVVATNMRFTGLSTRGIFGVDVNESTNVHLKDCSFSSIFIGPGYIHNAHFWANINLTLERCTSVGAGISYVMEDNSGRMVDCYGELTADGQSGVWTSLFLVNQDSTIGGRFDIVGGRFVCGLDGIAGEASGFQPRCAISLSDHILPTVADFSGLTITGASAVNRVVGGLSVAALSAVAGVIGLRFAGVSCVGAWLNAAPVAGTAAGQNHVIVS